MKRRTQLALLGVLLGAAIGRAAVIDERELLVRNRLGGERLGVLATVTLAELGVPPRVAARARSLEIVGADGKRYPCQLDRFAGFEGISPEIVVQFDLAAYELRALTMRLRDGPGADTALFCSVRVDGALAEVTTPVAVFHVRRLAGYGLRVEQPSLRLSAAQKKGQEDQLLEDMFDAELGGEEEEAETAEVPVGAVPRLKAPMSPDGLPFCVQGVSGFSAGAKLIVAAGPLRAVVSLVDEVTRPVDDKPVRGVQRQTFWFPRSGRAFYLDLRAHYTTVPPRGARAFAGVQVNSADYQWTLSMGQDGSPPYSAPVKIALRCTRKQPYLEPYQRKTFNNAWAIVEGKPGWIALLVDQANGRFATATDWASGGRWLGATMRYDDPGPYSPSLAARVRSKRPLANDIVLRAAVLFGGKDDKRPDLKAASEGFSSTVALLPRPAAAAPTPDYARLRQLAASKSVLIVTPDVDGQSRAPLWTRLADCLGGSWRPSRAVLQHFNVVRQGRADPELLTVLVGEPGTNPLLDQFNETFKAIDAYPSASHSVIRLADAADDAGAVLFIAGNRKAATAAAVERFIAAFGAANQRPAITLSPRDWAAAMPAPWHGLKDHQGAFRGLAYANGYADQVLLLRANRRLTDVSFTGPPGSVCRFIPWTYESRFTTAPRVRPLHDAAFSEIPTSLEAGSLTGIWISTKLAADAKPGVQSQVATLRYSGQSRRLELETEVLPLRLPDQQAMGFRVMGFHKAQIAMYYGWDEQTYLERLPQLLRQRGEFGANSFSLDAAGLQIQADAQGRVTVDSSGLARELAAVRSAGGIDVLAIHNPKHLWAKRELAKIVRAHKLADSFAAWEVIIPEVRAELRRLGLEDKLVCRYADEIPDYERWLATARLYQRCGFRMTVAINGYGVAKNELAVGAMGLWIPLYNFFLNRWGKPIADDDTLNFSKNFRDQRLAAGEEIWPYVCGPGPYAWSTRPRSQARFLVLDAYMKGANGLTYYGGAVWSHIIDPAYRKTVKADLFEKDATFFALFYPDAEHDALLPSLRVGAFRLGLEDATATKVVRDRAQRQGRLPEAERELQSFYEKIEMNSPQQTFNEYRRLLSRLNAGE